MRRMRPTNGAATLLAGSALFAGCLLPGLERGEAAGGEGGTGGVVAVASGAGITGGGGSGATTGEDMGSTGTGEPGCPRCAPEVTGSWIGPALLLSGDATTNGCPNTLLHEGFRAEAAPAECSCTCGLACGDLTLTVHHNLANCSGTSGNLSLGSTCADGNIGVTTSSSWRLSVPSKSGCAPKSANSKAPVSLELPVRLCEATALDGECGSGACLAAVPQDASVCVYQIGAHECPSAYPTRTFLVHALSEVDDTRACEECSCGTPMTGTCQGTLFMYNDLACGGTFNDYAANNVCYGGWNIHAKSWKGQVQGPSCQPQGGAPIGGVTVAAGGVTVCCVEPGR